MNATAHMSQAAALASAASVTSHTPLDADRSGDVYAIWKAVFERARPIAAPRDETGRRSDARVQGGSGAGGEIRARIPVAPRGDRAPFEASAAQLAISTGSTSVIAAAEADLLPVARASLIGQTNAGPRLARADAARTALRATAQPAGAEAHAVIDRSSTALAQSVSTDSVSVFVQGAAVAIVVRDPALSEHDAVRCAFETARELTGQRASLQQLTLNGRTLYQQHCDSSVRAALPEATLVFAC